MLAFVVVACGPESDSSAIDTPEYLIPDWTLEEVASYGWESLADSGRTLSEVDRRFAGAVLGEPLDVFEGSDGTVYVVDASFRKVVAFEPDGTFEGLILGGFGEGPGEFVRPRSIASVTAGDLWVFDQLKGRLSHFGANGELIGTGALRFGRTLDITGTHQGLFANRAMVDTSYVIALLTGDGDTHVPLVYPTSAELIAVGGRGAGAVGAAPDGSVIYGSPIVGQWRRVDSGGASELRGAPLFRSQAPVHWTDQFGNRRTTLLQEIWAAGQFRDGRILLYYVVRPRPGGDPDFRLALFDSVQGYLGSHRVEADMGTFTHSLREPDVFVVRSDPYPRIVRLRISNTAGGTR